jgi:hypothetical protein
MVAMTHALMWLASSLVLKSSKGHYIFFSSTWIIVYPTVNSTCAAHCVLVFSLAASAGVFLHHPLLASLSGVERLTNGKQQHAPERETHKWMNKIKNKN